MVCNKCNTAVNRLMAVTVDGSAILVCSDCHTQILSQTRTTTVYDQTETFGQPLVCSLCAKEAKTVTAVPTKDGPYVTACSTCAPNDPRINYKARMHLDGGGEIGVAHYHDIKSRKVAPDGNVYRDTGRKSFLRSK